MKTLFDDLRMTAQDAIELTAEQFNHYGGMYDHWALSFSGGKDSTTVLTLLAYLIDMGRVKPPKSINVMYCDTGMEITPLHLNALRLLEQMRGRGWNCAVIRPKLDDRFFVYMLGRGVPPPQPGFRWCVGNLKLEPMEGYLNSLKARCGRFVTFTGVRVGESAARDQRIAIACTKDGAECSQGHLQYSAQANKASDLCHPIIHWRVCQVWEWLITAEVEHGFSTMLMAEAYGGDEAEEINARTGCIQCNVAKRDMALENLAKGGKWAYLAPLMRLRDIYSTLSRPKSRHKKLGGERNADGKLSKNQGRLGPLTMKARRWGLNEILTIQSKINERAAELEMPEVTLIYPEEIKRIYWSWEQNLYPRKWDGSEPTGSKLLDSHYADGTVQPVLFDFDGSAP